MVEHPTEFINHVLVFVACRMGLYMLGRSTEIQIRAVLDAVRQPCPDFITVVGIFAQQVSRKTVFLFICLLYTSDAADE